jgi:membrane-bound lytic murein transglycosylase D
LLYPFPARHKMINSSSLVSIKYFLAACTISVLGSVSSYGQELEDVVPAYDYVPDLSYVEVGDRLSTLDFTVPLVYNEKVKSFIDYFTVRDRDYTRGILAKKRLYFPLFEAYLAKHDIPDELKYLSVVESGLNPRAISRAGAGGLWQFMPATGKMFQLHQDWYIDERLDPDASTEAACKYLKSLYRQFGDWELALAAYNTGPGNVRKAIRKSGDKKTFWEIYPYLPRETRSYVPQFTAIIYSLNFAEDHNLWAEELYPMVYDTVHVSSYLHLETFASQINVCLEDLLELNPHIKRGAIPEGRKNFALKIPSDVKPFVVQSRMALYDSASKVGRKDLEVLATHVPGGTFGKDKLVYKVRSGDVLGKIASNYKVNVNDLKTWNKLSSNTIYIGQNLSIWVLPSLTASNKEQYTVSTLPTTPTKNGDQFHKVQSGDTLWSIAKRYENTSIEGIKKLNNLTDSNIKVGQLLLVSKN